MQRRLPAGLLAILASAALGQDGKTVIPATPLVPPGQAASAQPEKAVYDESADGAAQIAAALAKAGQNNRRVLIQWGANWCGWCVKLHGVMRDDQALRKELLYEYDVVHIDIGKFDKHMELAEKYSADLKGSGVPFLTILDGDGRVLANQETGSLENPAGAQPSHNVEKVMAFLKAHQAEYPSATAVLDAGLARARAEEKAAFVHFGAPWCGWCHRLEGFLAREDIAPIFEENFVDIKIDTDRTIGGGEMLNEMRKSQRGGIPWFTILDASGKEIVNSSSAGENIGYPGEEEGAKIFVGMLRRARPGITDEQLRHIETELVNSMKRPGDR